MRELLSELHELVIDLMLESNDPDYSNEEQRRIHRQAKEIRKRLVRLRQMVFDEGTEVYNEANNALRLVNEDLRLAPDRINNLVEFFGNMARLAAALDKLIETAMRVA